MTRPDWLYYLLALVFSLACFVVWAWAVRL